MSNSLLMLYVLLASAVLLIVLMQLGYRTASPLVLIADRWLRWFLFAFGAAHFCREYGWIERPYWALVGAFFLLWFLLVTLYDWLAITAHSLSGLPLFPRYAVNSSGDEWPVQPRLLRTREWLKNQGFRQVQALKADVGAGVQLRTSVYQDGSGSLRVQVTFLPQPSGAISACYGVTSVATDGSRYVTDNLYLPFAGFYPENWFVERRPWQRSLPGLIRRHRARLEGAAACILPFAAEPLADLNAAQEELDQLNTELGFLHPHAEREDLGKFTQEGRYRVWKEIWMLNYLGRAARYN